MSEWQPIETAPRGGVEIIGIFLKRYSPEDKPSIYGPWTVAYSDRRRRWMASWDGAFVIESQDDFGIDYKDPDIQPTHWMPLPAPPTDAESA